MPTIMPAIPTWSPSGPQPAYPPGFYVLFPNQDLYHAFAILPGEGSPWILQHLVSAGDHATPDYSFSTRSDLVEFLLRYRAQWPWSPHFGLYLVI